MSWVAPFYATDDKQKNSNKNVTSNKTKDVLVENELTKLQKFD